MALSKEEFIRLLEERRDIEIPEAVEQLQAKIESLSKEKVDIDCQIKHLKSNNEEKTIFDIPSLVWREITGNLFQPQNEIHALSLSSEILAETVLEEGSEYIKMEKSFTLLCKNFYLDRDDLLNCITTTSAELGKLTAKTWGFLENSDYKTVDLIKSKSFQAEIESRKAEHELWKCFAGKHILFKLTDRQPNNWNESMDILQKYGKFFVNIELQLEDEDLETGEKTDYIHNMLLNGNLPNLQFFKVLKADYETKIYELFPQMETRSLQNFMCLSNPQYCYPVENYKALLKLPAMIAEVWYNHGTQYVLSFKNLKALTYHDCDKDEEVANNVIAAQTNRLLQIKQLALSSNLSLDYNLKLAEKFPALSEIYFIELDIFDIGRERKSYQGNIRIPTVRKLAYCVDRVKLPRLRDLFAVFPSLRCFTMKTRFHRDGLQNSMQLAVQLVDENRNNAAGGVELEDFDIYQRISNEQPLTESDIWAQVPNLNVLRLITMYDYFEKYTRGFDDGECIRVEKYKENSSMQFPIIT